MPCKFDIRGSYPTGIYFMARVTKTQCDWICLRTPRQVSMAQTSIVSGDMRMCINLSRCKHVNLIDLAEQLRNHVVKHEAILQA